MTLPVADRIVTLPTAMTRYVTERSESILHNWHVTCDPGDRRLGSGGGTIHALYSLWSTSGGVGSFLDWVAKGPRLIIHGSGESRRLPAYSVVGKPLIPVPPVDPTAFAGTPLLGLQANAFEALARSVPWASVIVGSGDVLLGSGLVEQQIEESDVVIFGAPSPPETAQHFGVLFVDEAGELIKAVQKPSPEEIRSRSSNGSFLLDTGAWALGPRAIRLLMDRCGFREGPMNERWLRCELYAGLGSELGRARQDTGAGELSVKVARLPKRAFRHFGATRQMLDAVPDALNGPCAHIVNSRVDAAIPSHGKHWIHNAHIPRTWQLSGDHVITGVPDNEWKLKIDRGTCLDLAAVGESGFCLRTYAVEDVFRGPIGSDDTSWMGMPARRWFADREISLERAGVDVNSDIYDAPIFPVIGEAESSDRLQWIIGGQPLCDDCARWWVQSHRLSARNLSVHANIARMAIPH